MIWRGMLVGCARRVCLVSQEFLLSDGGISK
jgi:hypothetical protein